MEHKVIFRDNQELQGGDLNNQQDFAQSAIDHVVLDTIEPGKAYSGFALTKGSATTVQVAPGRLYSAGEVFARDELVTLDLYNDLPVTTKRQFAIVCWGQEVSEDIQPRNFVTDAKTGAAEPQSVAMETTRYCNVNYVRGIESADPQFPTIDANVLLIGYVLCDPTGILTIQQSTATQVPNLAHVADEVGDLQTWQQQISGAIDTLRTDLANIARRFDNYVTTTTFQRLVDLVNIIYNKVFSPGTYIFYGNDNFLDETQSAVGTTVDGAYSATVREGLRFPGGGAGSTGVLELLNANEPAIQAYDTFILPKPSGSRVRVDCSFPDYTWVLERILASAYWASFTFRHLTWTRHRHRCGPHFLPSPSSTIWWYNSANDPVEANLSIDGESWTTVPWSTTIVHDDHPDFPRFDSKRFKFFWHDFCTRHHWAKNYTNYSHGANIHGQSFLNSQDGWLESITVFSHKTDYFQPLTILIVECDDHGAPDMSRGIRRVVLDADGVEAAYAAPVVQGDVLSINNIVYQWDGSSYDVRIPRNVKPLRLRFPPVFLKAGQVYSFLLLSTYDHQFSVSDRNEAFHVHQGYFWSFDGVGRLVKWTSTVKSLRFRAHFCTWGLYGQNPNTNGQVNYAIDLQPLQLSGGIGSIDVLADTIIPPATDLSYQIQISGVWVPFAGDPDTPSLALNPALLPFRVVFSGTTDLMPGLSLTNSQVKLERAMATAFHHISTTITLGTPTNSIKVIVKMLNFVEAHHDCTITLHYAGPTHKSADVVADVTLDDDTIQRTATFNVSSVSSFQVEIDGATDGVGDNFVVAQAIRYAT
jgi:hypothetical protein